MYATLDDYITWLRGRNGAIPFADFDFWAAQAGSEIDLITFNRLHDPDTLTEFNGEVTQATCELAEALFSTGTTSEKTLSSMSIGSYSESYVKEDKEATQKRINGIIRRGLGHTGLLYRGGM